MRVVVQRVSSAQVTVKDSVVGKIDAGLLLFVGITHDDTISDITWLIKKLINLRIFNDSDHKMNLSIKDIDGHFLVISQFTLFASTKKGNRPSYINSAKPELANELYDIFIKHLDIAYHNKCQTGVFGAEMKVELLNDGPVTILLDSQQKL